MKELSVLYTLLIFLAGAFVSYKWMEISQRMGYKSLIIINYLMLLFQLFVVLFLGLFFRNIVERPLNMELNFYRSTTLALMILYYFKMFQILHKKL